ncbi:MAG: serine hydrolase [Gammaproteobacteria bacterium]
MMTLLRIACLCIAAASLPAWSADVTPTIASHYWSAYPHLRRPFLRSGTALAVDQRTRQPLLAKNTDRVVPIASITKLMTAMVVLDAKLPLGHPITITKADIDRLKDSHSRLAVGTTLSRGRLLKLALMASENRAAAALARTYPGGKSAFVTAMNRKAAQLDMKRTHFVDATGLNPQNVSTAHDLVRMVEAASRYRLIHEATTSRSAQVVAGRRHHRRVIAYRNTDPLVHNPHWHIGLSKTGYISEAGRCLVVQATIGGHKTIIVLLDSWGRLSRVGDANRIRHWLERGRRHGAPPHRYADNT